MRKALIYFYEVQGNDKKKANGGIGIVPFVYQDAYNYHYNLWLAKERNRNKNIQEFIPKTIEVKIPPPQRKVKVKKKFTFLDEEEVVDNEQ
jgi:hypothetical protein